MQQLTKSFRLKRLAFEFFINSRVRAHALYNQWMWPYGMSSVRAAVDG